MRDFCNGSRRALVLAPHTDDAELGCGGTIARLLQTGAEVFLGVWSTCEASLPADSSPTLLKDEFMEAMQRFGISQERLYIFGYPVRQLSYHRQAVLENLVALRSDVKPDIVFLPSGSDLHQDHQVLHAEGVRAFKEGSLLGYELPWNHINFSAQAFVTLERDHLRTKWEALTAYNSQFQAQRPYFCWSFIEGLARVRGVQIKVEYAEAFEVVRLKW